MTYNFGFAFPIPHSPFPMNVVLIGYRGTGKTTVAQQLALRLGWDWVDADVEIELRAGKSIAAIFADDGEPTFRELESHVLAATIGRPQIVLAAGGGVVLREDNRRLLRTAGKVVWLTADVATILARVAADQTTAIRRPQLTTAGGEAEVRQLLARRTPLYRELADLEIDTEGRTPAEIVEEIVEAMLNDKC
jgi:shikimate kinase